MVQTPAEKKEKARWARILKIYGLTKEDYESLDLGYCPICLSTWDSRVRPCVDHDHSHGGPRSQRVRGILCSYCNRYRVGRFRDADIVYRIARYLDQQPTTFVIPKAPKKKRKKRAS